MHRAFARSDCAHSELTNPNHFQNTNSFPFTPNSGWVQTHDRQLTYAFTRPFHKQEVVALWVKNSSALMYASGIDLTNKKVGFIDGWYSEEICLARYATAATNPITV